MNKRSMIHIFTALCLLAVPASASATATAVPSAPSIAAQTTSETVSIPSVRSLDLEVKSAVLVEPSTGQVILSINADKAYAPASMTKMMTAYIVADQVKKGEISWNDVVTVQENASKTIGSRVYLAKGEKHTVKSLFHAMLIHSANDAAVALAEYTSGSEQQFVQRMNEEAKRMGMKKTFYVNVTGLDRADMPLPYRPAKTGENSMSAMDVATLVKHIISDHPEIVEVSSLPTYQFRATDKPLVNTNWMLESNEHSPTFQSFAYEGLDGMKTGFTDNAGYCFAGTAQRDGMRLISVVMGTDSASKRFTETKKVLDYGFHHFEKKQVVAGNQTAKGLERVTISKGKETEVPVVTQQAVEFLVPKGTDPSQLFLKTNFAAEALTAPVQAGTKAGTVTYTYQIEGMDTAQVKTVNLVTVENVEKAGWFRLLFRSIWEGVRSIF